jgi:hypothetical protein
MPVTLYKDLPMKQNIITAILIMCTGAFAVAQTDSPTTYSRFPLVVSIQFHAFSVPLHDLTHNFRNVGIGLGTEINYNRKANLVQQLSMVWYRNQAMGNGLLFYTQGAWRPEIQSDFFTELKAGVGYLLSFRPVDSYEQKNGNWISAGRKGKGMLTLPLGVSVGYNTQIGSTPISPFVSYQFLVVSGYNTSIPIVPETLVQIGSRIHLNK